MCKLYQNIVSKIYYTAFLLLFLLIANLAKSQVNEQKIKAALIFKIAKNINWENEQKIKQFNFTILSSDSVLINELEKISKIYTLKEKKIHIYKVNSFNKIKTHTHVLFVDKNYNNEFAKNYNLINKKNTLLITEYVKNNSLTMVNMFKDKQKILYKVNQENIKNANLNCLDDLLLYGGSLVDVKKLYEKINLQLISKTEDYEKLKTELKQIKTEKDSINKEINRLKENTYKLMSDIYLKEKKLTALQSNIDKLSTNIVKKDSTLLNKAKELNMFMEKSNILQEKINKAESQLYELDSFILDKQNFINQQNNIIDKQENIIIKKDDLLMASRQKMRLQQFILLISIAFILLSIIAVFLYVKAYKIKKQLSEKLEIMVAEKTKELEKSKQHFEKLFESSPVALLELDLSQVYSYLKSFAISDNEVLELLKSNKEVVKTTAKKIILKNINAEAIKLFKIKSETHSETEFMEKYTLLHLEDIYEQYKSMVLNKTIYYNYETVRQISDNEKINVKINWVLLHDKEKLSNVLIAIQDITEIKRYEQELTKHKNNLEEIVIERTNEIRELNKELSGINDELFAKNEDLMNKNFQMENQQNRIKLLNNKLIDTNINLKKRKEHLKSTIEQLQSTQKQLAQSEKMASLGLLTAGIAHELNNPINFISAGSQILKNLFVKLSPVLELYNKYKEKTEEHTQELKILTKPLYEKNIKQSIENVLNNIEKGIERSTNIIRGLTIYSRKDDDVPIPYDIKKAIQDILIILKSKYKNRIVITEKYESDTIVKCMAGKINQVLMNILANAIDSITDKGQITIRIYSDKKDKNLIISVKDTGVGMSKEVQMKIFDPFFTTKKVGKGVGLGLYITYGIIQQHKGKISVYSQKGKGSNFVISLPKN